MSTASERPDLHSGGKCRVVLHLGAHKTATTFLQGWLTSNYPALRSVGVLWPRLDHVRSKITKACWRPKPENVDEARAFIRGRLAKVDSPRCLVISDENVLGVPMRPGTEAWYPHVADRLGALSQILAGLDDDVDPVPEVAISVRSFDRFASSMYAESLRHGPFVSSQDYLSAVDTDRVGWQHVVRHVLDSMQPSRLWLWRYEDFREHSRRILDWVIPELAGIELRPLTGDRNRSITTVTVRALNVLSRELDKVEYSAVRDVLSRAAIDGDPVEIFDSEEATALQRRFEQDVETCAGMSRVVRLFEPGVE